MPSSISTFKEDPGLVCVASSAGLRPYLPPVQSLDHNASLAAKCIEGPCACAMTSRGLTLLQSLPRSVRQLLPQIGRLQDDLLLSQCAAVSAPLSF